MNPFEKFRTLGDSGRAKARAEDAARGVQAALDDLAAANERVAKSEREAAYAAARLAELTPLLREQTRLALEEGRLRSRVEHGETALGLLRKILGRRLPPRPEPDEFVRQEADETEKLTASRNAHAAATAELARVEKEIETKDAELRSRFSLPG